MRRCNLNCEQSDFKQKQSIMKTSRNIQVKSLTKHLSITLFILLMFSFPVGAVEYVNGTHVSSLDNSDDKFAGPMDIGFTFPFYGVNYTQFNVTTNGVVSFGGAATTYANAALPANTYNFPAVFPFWEDLHPSGSANINGYILYRTIAAGDHNNPYGDNVAIVQWTNYGFFGKILVMGTFQVHMVANGSIVFNYNDLISPELSYGQSATIGIQENGTGNFSQHSYNADAGIRSGYIIRFDKINDTAYNKSEASTNGFWDILLYKDGGVQPPGKPVNLTPTIGTNVFVNPTLRWDVADNADDYRVVVSNQSNLNSPVFTSNVTDNFTTVSGLSEDTTYYWQVIANNSGGETPSDLCNFNASIAPASVTGLSEYANSSTWINWTWTNPLDSDFNHTMVYLNGTFMINVTGTSYNATGLDDNTDYEIQTRTVDSGGNINSTWVNDSASTLNTLPPASVTGLSESNSDSTWIEWTWINPVDDDFNYTMVYLDNIFKANTTSTSYTATGLSASTSYNISTKTVDTYGNINATWINDTASTDAAPTPPTESSGPVNLPTPLPENVVNNEVKGTIFSEPVTSADLTFTKGYITLVTVDAKGMISEVMVTIQKLAGKPSEIKVAPPSGAVHTYHNIDLGRIENGDLAGATIKFKAEKKWIADNGGDRNKVVIMRYHDTWMALETKPIGEDDEYVFFSARTPGFSTFAITMELDEEVAPVEVLTPEPVIEEVVDEVVPEPKEETSYWWLIFLIIAIVGVVFFVYK
ncbi:MAG: PGF-pre-PGF domain-containing protein, partial [Methanosarcinaceae archaeon]|nr:PGF-pre-PGF domain-containing protein [Methanosarcinaceae archaeon]